MSRSKPSLVLDDGPDTEAIKLKYAEVAKNRNAFLLKALAGTVAIAVGLTIPKLLMNRAHAFFWRKYVKGDVLTLTPKLLESDVVEHFEATNAVRVSCIVRQKIKSDEHYSEVLESASTEAEKQQATRDMTLCFLKTNDPHWVHSVITFDTVLEDQIGGRFSTVVIDNELWHTPSEATQRMMETAAKALAPEGIVVLTDVAAPISLRNVIRNLHKRTESDINLAHDFPELLANNGLEVIESRKTVFGFFQCYAANKKVNT